MNNKRRAPEILSEAQKQARFDDPFGAPTPAAAGATAAEENPFHIEDDGGYGDGGGFDESAFDDWNVSTECLSYWLCYVLIRTCRTITMLLDPMIT